MLEGGAAMKPELVLTVALTAIGCCVVFLFTTQFPIGNSEFWSHLVDGAAATATALATVFVARFTRELRDSTERLWSESERAGKAAEAAANAARESVNLAIAAERAHVFAEVYLVSWPERDWEEVKVAARVAFWNHGKTPAAITAIRGDLCFAVTAPPALVDTPLSSRKLPPSLGIATNSSHDTTISRRIGEGEWSGVVEGDLRCFCVGEIRYEDIMGQAHATGFCWELSLARDQYSVSPSALNFRE
jgi:hypothetical protein